MYILYTLYFITFYYNDQGIYMETMRTVLKNEK